MKKPRSLRVVEGDPAVAPRLPDVVEVVAFAGEMKEDVPLFDAMGFVVPKKLPTTLGDPKELGEPFFDGRVDNGGGEKLIMTDRTDGKRQIPGRSQMINPKENLAFVSGQGEPCSNPRGEELSNAGGGRSGSGGRSVEGENLGLNLITNDKGIFKHLGEDA